jgi:hypothetical protein
VASRAVSDALREPTPAAAVIIHLEEKEREEDIEGAGQ